MTSEIQKKELGRLPSGEIYSLPQQKQEIRDEKKVKKLDENCRLCKEISGTLLPATMTASVLANNLTFDRDRLKIVEFKDFEGGKRYFVKKSLQSELDEYKKASDDFTEKAQKSMQKAIRAAVDAKKNNDPHAEHKAAFIAEEDFEEAVIHKAIYDWHKNRCFITPNRSFLPPACLTNLRDARMRANLALTHAIDVIANAKNMKNHFWSDNSKYTIEQEVIKACLAEATLAQAKKRVIDLAVAKFSLPQVN